MNISRTVFGLVALLALLACATPVFSQAPDNLQPGAARPLFPGIGEGAGPSPSTAGIPNDRLPFNLVDRKAAFQPSSNPDVNGAVMNASAETVYAPVTQLRERWDTTTNAWVNGTRTTWTYNGSNLLTNDLTETWNVSKWLNNSQNNYAYDGGGNRTEDIYQYWSGTSWSNFFRSTYTYDGSHRETQFVYQSWGGSDWT